MKKMVGRLLLVFVAWFAVQGGEYSTVALFKQKGRAKMLAAAIDSLKGEIDSLGALKRRLESDPATQERIAREEFGMVRGDKELLFRFRDADSLKPRR